VIFAVLASQIEENCVFLHLHSVKSARTYCSIVSQSPREKEQTPIIGTATQTGAAFPYLGVACGEP